MPSQIGTFVISPNSCKDNTTSSSASSSSASASGIISSSSSASGTPYPSSNATGIYTYPSYTTSSTKYYTTSAKTTSYVTKYTTSTKKATKTHTVTVKGSVSKSYETYTTTTVCPVVPSRVTTYKPTVTITKTVPKGFFAGPNGESYVFKPVITNAPASYSLTYASCKPKTVYATVTVY